MSGETSHADGCCLVAVLLLVAGIIGVSMVVLV